MASRVSSNPIDSIEAFWWGVQETNGHHLVLNLRYLAWLDVDSRIVQMVPCGTLTLTADSFSALMVQVYGNEE